MSDSGSADEITACTHCGKRFNVRSSQMGKRVMCRKCGESFKIAPVDELDELEELPLSEPAPRVAPPPPRAMPLGRSRVAPVAKQKPASNGGSVLGGFIGGMSMRNKIGIALLILVTLARVAVKIINQQPSHTAAAADESPTPSESVVAANDTPAPTPDTPDQPLVAVKPPPSMTFRTDSIGRKLGTVRAAMRSKSTMVDLVIPPGTHPAGSLPCVFVCPAGSNLMTGVAFDDGEREDYYGLLEKGIAVCFYSLDGTVDRNSDNDIRTALQARQFIISGGGLSNAEDAIDTVLAAAPEIDPARLGTAGHSSAGTAALTVAKGDPRIAAVGAMAPVIDIPKRFGDAMDTLNGELTAMVFKMSPSTIGTLNASVFIFATEDDKNVSPNDSKAFADKHAEKVTLKLVPTGGHGGAYQKGLPEVFDFFAKRFNATAIAGAGKVVGRRTQVAQGGPSRNTDSRTASPGTGAATKPAAVVATPSTRPTVKVAKMATIDLHSYGIPDGFAMTMSDDGKMFRVMNTPAPAAKRWGMRGLSVAAGAESPLMFVTSPRPGAGSSGKSYIASDGTLSLPDVDPKTVDGLGGQFAVFRFTDTEQDVPTAEAVIAFEAGGSITVMHIAFPRAETESVERFINMVAGWEIDRPAGAKAKAFTKAR